MTASGIAVAVAVVVITNRCVARYSKVRHTPKASDCKNALVLVGLYLLVTVHNGKVLGVIG